MFQKGQSGNPGGRPKGIAAYIREQTNEGKDLVDLYVRVFKGDLIDGKKPRLLERLNAGTWLADRGYGKPASMENDGESASKTLINVLAVLGELPPGTLKELRAVMEQRQLPEPVDE